MIYLASSSLMCLVSLGLHDELNSAKALSSHATLWGECDRGSLVRHGDATGLEHWELLIVSFE